MEKEKKKLNKNSYITIFLWMIEDLKLSGVKLQVFGVIYSFTNDGESICRPTIEYLKAFTGAGKTSIITALKELTEQGLIIKNDIHSITGGKNEYRANLEEIHRLTQEAIPDPENDPDNTKNDPDSGSKNEQGGGSKSEQGVVQKVNKGGSESEQGVVQKVNKGGSKSEQAIYNYKQDIYSCNNKQDGNLDTPCACAREGLPLESGNTLHTLNTAERSKCQQKFFNDFKIQIDGYNGNLGDMDFDLLYQAYTASANYLQQDNHAKYLSWICRNYKKIISGYYKDREDKPKRKTATEVWREIYEEDKAAEEAEEAARLQGVN